MFSFKVTIGHNCCTSCVHLPLYFYFLRGREDANRREDTERGGSLGVLTMRKIGGSRGNPPCVSCHWSSARRVPAKDCIGHLSRFLPSATYLLSKSRFSAARDAEQRYSPTHLIQKKERRGKGLQIDSTQSCCLFVISYVMVTPFSL